MQYIIIRYRKAQAADTNGHQGDRASVYEFTRFSTITTATTTANTRSAGRCRYRQRQNVYC